MKVKAMTLTMMTTTMTFNNTRLIWLLLLLMLLVSPVAEAKIYLVSVGVSDYPGRANDLRLPHNDAATMYWVYKENKNAETVLLMNSDATVVRVKSAMSQLYKKATSNDIVVLHFSGHGYRGGFACYDGNLEYGYIRNAMARCRSKNKIIFADACHSGAMRGNGTGFDSNYGGLNGANVMLFLSCRNNEYSIEKSNMTNGIFTYALQHGLRGGADYDKNRVVTARELFKYVSEKVKKMSGNKQHPVMWGKFSDSMPVMKW